ncbi:beta-mannosidase [Oleiagrimonas soli]|nr:glycoside hydrolase family 2 protein [Oleiagrimonas soli]MBB6184668.1 beta-mannosidase [Oleiagrimonas soli]
MRRGLALLVALAALLSGSPSWAATHAQTLDRGWQLRLAPNDAHAARHPAAARWLSATVPGTVQTDLIAAGLTPDPYLGRNEAAIQWVGLADWQYRLRFRVDPSVQQRRHVDLVLDGLDTFAEVSLNGHRLLRADNMFRRWRVPAKAWLRDGENTLVVNVHSPIRRVQRWLKKQPYALPGEFDSAFGDEPKGRQSANYVRKAAYQYGWDWGPRIVTEGIWQPVRLEGWDRLRVADLHIAQPSVDADAAQLRAQVTVQTAAAGTVQVRVDALAPDGRRVARAARTLTLTTGRHTVDLPLTIAHPQRWYPAGYGAQPLYRFVAHVREGDGDDHVARRTTGLRRIELRQRKDRWGRSFAFVVNGIPVFAKGANLVPFDSFPPRVTTARMRRLLDDARAAHMNMLRVWGGGYYLPDAFYAMADRRGLLIWQDFMFGGAIPPYDAAFRANVRVEAEQQVRRLRDHPSIALWSGNNEVRTSWETWGDRLTFQRAISAAERTRIDQGMRTLFGRVLRDVVAREDVDVPYWPGSPFSAAGEPANADDSGDTHFWNVWSGDAAPIEDYLDVTPRFLSEYGLQSLPVMVTVRAFAGDGPLDAESPVLRAHQKYDGGNGNRRLLAYVKRNYGAPGDFADLVYLSQAMQAEGIRLAAEHLRASRPRTMGSLYWQLNDVWPGASWSSVDVYGRWKALQFAARRFYAPLLLAALRHHDVTRVTLVSDRLQPTPLRWRWRVMDFRGHVLRSGGGAVMAAPTSATPLARYTDAALLHGADPRTHMVVFELLEGQRTVARNLVFFGKPRTLQLPLPKLTVQWSRDADGAVLRLHTDTLARAVWIDVGDPDAVLSDNAFNLLPGETRIVHVRSAHDLATLERALTLRDLADVMKRDATP